MKDFLRRLFQKTNRSQVQPAVPQSMLTPLLMGLEQTRPVEYDCEDVYRLMDQYVELLKRGEDPAVLMPLVEHHLKMCGDCREELEALLRMMNSGAAL
jgi:hypothetical protein